MSEFDAFYELGKLFHNAKHQAEQWMSIGLSPANAAFLATLEWPR